MISHVVGKRGRRDAALVLIERPHLIFDVALLGIGVFGFQRLILALDAVGRPQRLPLAS